MIITHDSQGRPFRDDISFRDSQQAFRDALANGIFDYEDTDRWVGHFMYMHTDAAGQDVFKHRDTREYLTTDYIV